MKREEKRSLIRKQVKDALKGIDNRKVATEIIIEEALKRASIYKYQKVLLMIELSQKTTEGEYQSWKDV